MGLVKDRGNGEVIARAFFEIGDKGHKVDNAYCMDSWWEPQYTLIMTYMREFIDEDPGTTKRPFVKTLKREKQESGSVSRKKTRLIWGPNAKMEQTLVFETGCKFKILSSLYDITMRKFIKEKFGIEIQSLSEKWSRLCWNCAEEKADLKKCSKCFIGQYCSKECQRADWKVHKEHHGVEEFWKPYVLAGLE